MFKYYLKLFVRTQKKNKSVALINLTGLVIGLLSSLFIFEYVFYQRSFDRFNQKGDRICRVAYDRYQNGKLQWKTANSFMPTGPWLKEHYSEVEDFATLSRKYNITVSTLNAAGDRVAFNEAKAYYATASLFNLFSFPITGGEIQSLTEPGTVAISEQAARKYFGKVNPIGQLLTVNQREQYTVSAVFGTIPSNSHLKSDFFFSFPSYTQTRQNLISNWSYDLFHTYLLLAPGIDPAAFCSRALPDMIEKNYKQSLDNRSMNDEFYLQPLTGIHLHSNIEYETEPPGNARIVNILFGFAIFLLGVAWINYINLVTALSLDRAREIGIKKINGARKTRLLGQFISETFLFNLISLLITLILFFALNPLFCQTTGIEHFNLLRLPGFVVIGLLVFLSGILLSSLYPAMILSSYQPLIVLKGKFKHSNQGLWFRKGLVTAQFIISIVLLTGTLIAFKQANLLIKKDMGISYHSTLVVRAPRTTDNLETRMNKLMLFKNKVNQIPGISDFTCSSDIPGEEITNFFGGRRKGFDVTDNKGYYQIAADNRFIDFYKVNLLAGRQFNSEERYEQRTIILNKLAVERFGYSSPEEAVGKILVNGSDREWEVIGVVDDFHYRSVKLEPMPTIITLNDNPKLYMSVRIDGSQSEVNSQLLAALKSSYQSIFPDQPFDYFSLDEKMQADLRPDKTFASVFSIFSGLAIFIAIIGIVALILITIRQNLKELGVRKALGAQLTDLTQLLSKQVLKQLIAAIVLAVPLSYYGYKTWFLENYLHRIELSWWLFALPVVLMLGTVAVVLMLLANNVARMKTNDILQKE